MKRKIFAALLVAVLTLALAVPVFAHGYTEYLTYNNAEVEANAQCGGNSYSASTNTMSHDFLVKTTVAVNLPAPEGTADYYYVYGREQLVSSVVRASGTTQIDHIVTYHYAGGHLIYSRRVNPSE